MAPRTVETHGEDETRALARRLGARLPVGAFVGLVGPLGAGKTRFVQGLCDGLGVPADEVVSPTFALVNTYQGRLPVFHVDLYRVGDLEEVEGTGLVDLMPTGVTVVEWADRVPELAPPDALIVKLEDRGPERRLLVFDGAVPEGVLEGDGGRRDRG